MVTTSELYFGAENGLHRKHNLELLERFLLDFHILPLDLAVAREIGLVRAALEKSGKRIGVMETLIAAHARALGLTVVTNNVVNFSKVKGLGVENWSQ